VLECHTIHQSVNRPNLLLGGDQKLVALSAMFCFGLAVSMFTWWSFLAALVLWLIAVYGLQALGREDPMGWPVYVRNFWYKPYYPAKSGLYSRSYVKPNSWR
jgi:type IV secretion system protein VirB3